MKFNVVFDNRLARVSFDAVKKAMIVIWLDSCDVRERGQSPLQAIASANHMDEVNTSAPIYGGIEFSFDTLEQFEWATAINEPCSLLIRFGPTVGRARRLSRHFCECEIVV